MAHFASNGFGIPGGIDGDDFKQLCDPKPTVGQVFRVISRPSFVPCPMGVTYTQYSTCPFEKVDLYTAHGWKDEGFESENEKVCIDWINTKVDCSFEVRAPARGAREPRGTPPVSSSAGRAREQPGPAAKAREQRPRGRGELLDRQETRRGRAGQTARQVHLRPRAGRDAGRSLLLRADVRGLSSYS